MTRRPRRRTLTRLAERRKNGAARRGHRLEATRAQTLKNHDVAKQDEQFAKDNAQAEAYVAATPRWWRSVRKKLAFVEVVAQGDAPRRPRLGASSGCAVEHQAELATSPRRRVFWRTSANLTVAVGARHRVA